MSPHKLRTVSVVEAIAEQLSEDIFSGMFRPGETLIETQLAARFEVPRQTIRSAVVMLIHDGILRREPNRSVYIPRFSESDIRDLFAVRRLIELETVRILTTRKVVPKDAENAVRFMEVLRDEDGWDEVLKFDFEFHQALVAATGSTRLQKFYRSISAEKRLALTYFRSSHESPSEIARQHRVLLDTIRAGDPDAAVEAFSVHLDESEAFIDQVIHSQQKQPSSTPPSSATTENDGVASHT
ncbi:GntR family transcriptional regulator [Halopseudomonas sp. SMJS2]|uniref:GntR family transcriptional regulator n=1 Tax=Halopseudomonas sp. SMJS2 TaxID=3041098 RepID=UPI002453086B|nr:GntR family transcriptional regulator [Halopseudomonas sp. SMJS2]WGK60382.1 GntR family transcriptional regulator [Halopseudomonas sp. SMJS2]